MMIPQYLWRKLLRLDKQKKEEMAEAVAAVMTKEETAEAVAAVTTTKNAKKWFLELLRTPSGS